MTTHTDTVGARLGMWLFLFTEIMLFGGLFVLYAAYFYRYFNDFSAAGKELDVRLGTINTVILLISSFTIASAIAAVEKGSKKLGLGLMAITVACGLAFLGNKYIEWSSEIAQGNYPNSDHLVNGPHAQTIFYGLYYTLTGLHGLHVFIGMSVISACMVLTAKGKIHSSRMAVLENTGLFWHLIDIIWIFLFPLLYLIP